MKKHDSTEKALDAVKITDATDAGNVHTDERKPDATDATDATDAGNVHTDERNPDATDAGNVHTDERNPDATDAGNVHTDEQAAPSGFRLDMSGKSSSMLSVIDSSVTSLDLSGIRARFARFGNETIADALTDFVKADAVEQAALPLVRVHSVARIMRDKTALDAISKATDTDGKEYGKKRAPLTVFLMDNLELGKTQATEYINVARIATDENGALLPDFVGLSFSQLKLVCKAYKPYDAVKAIDAALSVADYKTALDKWETEERKADAAKHAAEKDAGNVHTDERKPDATDAGNVHTDERKPDATDATDAGNVHTDERKPEGNAKDAQAANMPRFVVGTMPANNSANFTPWPQVKDADGNTIPEQERKPRVFVAKNAATLIDDLRKAMHTDLTLTVKLPNTTLKTLVSRLPDALNGYKVHGAFFDIVHSAAARIVIVASVETTGTTEQDETTAQKAKRVKAETDSLMKWMCGAADYDGIFKAVENPTYAMEIFSRAKGMVENLPRMTAVKAIALCVKHDAEKAGKIETTPDETTGTENH